MGKQLFLIELNSIKRRTVRIFSKILAVVLVFVFGITLMPVGVDNVYAADRGRYVFPADSSTATGGTSLNSSSGLHMVINNPNGWNKAKFESGGTAINLNQRVDGLSMADTAGFACSVNKYNIADNDFEITYIANHPTYAGLQDNDGGFAFVFHNDPNHTLQERSGSGALGIYGAYTDNSGVPDSRYSLLENALAVELDAASYRTQVGNSGKYLWVDDRTPFCTNFLSKRYAHLAITRPDYAHWKDKSSDSDKILHYAREDVPVPVDSNQRIAVNSVVNIKWELTGNVNGENEYTLTAKYYHNTTIASGTPAIEVSQTFKYSVAFGPGGLFGGTEEVYVGFSAGRELSSVGGDMIVRLAGNTRYYVYHVKDSATPWTVPGTDPRIFHMDTRYAPLNSKLNLTERIRTDIGSEYIFDRAYYANGDEISNISLVDFTAANQKYYMSYVKKIIYDPPLTEDPPAGYRRIIFDPTADGKITDTGILGTKKVFDVHRNLTWGEAWVAIQSQVPAVFYKDETKGFTGWNPALPTDNGALISSIPPDNPNGNTTTFTAVYKDRIIEEPVAAQLNDLDYVIIRFDANDLNNDTADEEIRGRLNSKIPGSTVANRETITYAVLIGTKWSYFANIAATPNVDTKSPYWWFDNGNGSYIRNNWWDARVPTGTGMIPAHDDPELNVETIFAGTTERYKTYFAQYTQNTPMGVMIKTGELPFWVISLGLLLLGIILISRQLKKISRREGF
ncbi:MAG: hypothetical protein ACOX4R_06610 [Lentihominibacter sp.]|jgi:hypothetical protein